MTHKAHIAIIGGGITGLTAAYQIMQQSEADKLPVTCTVFEQDKRFGGKIRTHREGGFILEGGPDSMLARKPAGMQLIRELGIESEVVGMRPAKTYILHQGTLKLIPPGTNMGIPMDLTPFLQSDLLSTAGKLRAMSDMLLPASGHSDDESLGQFLRRRLGDEVVNNLNEPLMAGIYAGKIDDLSLQATFPQFQKMEKEDRSLILGSRRQRNLQSRASNNGGNAANTGTNSSRSVFITLRGGLETLTERLTECLQDFATLQSESTVEGLARLADGRYQLQIRQHGEMQVVHADAVILTTPTHIAADLLSNLIPSAHRLHEVANVSTATIIVGYLKSQLDVSLDASGFVIPRGENRAITASTWVSTKWPHTSLDDHVVIRCYVGRSGQEEGLRLNDKEMVNLVRDELREILGITATPVFSKVTRWDNAMPQYYVNHLDLVAQIEQDLAAHTPGLYATGAGYRGVGIPDCIVQGRSVATTALEYVREQESHRVNGSLVEN